MFYIPGNGGLVIVIQCTIVGPGSSGCVGAGHNLQLESRIAPVDIKLFQKAYGCFLNPSTKTHQATNQRTKENEAIKQQIAAKMQKKKKKS